MIRELPSCFRWYIPSIFSGRGARRAGWLFFIYSFSVIALASTNKVALDYQNKIDSLAKTFGSQWDVLTKSSDEFTASINDNVKKYSRIDRLELLDKLMKRIKNKNDQLNSLDKYESAIYGGGDAHLVYDAAYAMIRKGDLNRSIKLFKFLINDKNPSGFTVGNSHYWYAYYLYFIQKDRTNALNHYLQVHKYSSCLVFTDASYCRAARIYNELGKPDIALALYSIQIPHIDHWEREMLKADRSFDIAIHQGDYSNAIYQIERKNRAIAAMGITNQFYLLRWKGKIEKIIYRKMKSEALAKLNLNQSFTQPTKRNARKKYKDITKHIKTFASPDSYEIKCIKQALDGPEKGKDNLLLKDMLLHAWPMMEDVDPVILTNRVLSNNIFKHEDRKL